MSATRALRLLTDKVEIEDGAANLYLTHGEVAAIPIVEMLLPDE